MVKVQKRDENRKVVQNQPPKVFYRKAALKNFASYIHRKKSVLDSLFNKVGDLNPCNFIKGDTDTGVFL